MPSTKRDWEYADEVERRLVANLAAATPPLESGLDDAADPPWAALTADLPSGYHLDLTGLYHVGLKGKAQDRHEVHELIAGPVWVAGEFASWADGSHGLLIRWLSRTGVQHQVTVHRRELLDARGSLAGDLADRGLTITPGAVPKLLAYLAASSASTRFTAVDRTGWAESPGGQAVFVHAKRGPIA